MSCFSILTSKSLNLIRVIKLVQYLGRELPESCPVV